jgi:hypothetical protein
VLEVTCWCSNCRKVRSFTILDDLKLSASETKTYRNVGARPVSVTMPECGHVTRVVVSEAKTRVFGQ